MARVADSSWPLSRRDYRLRLDNGQELSATLTQRVALAEGAPVQVGICAEEIVLLEEDEPGAA